LTKLPQFVLLKETSLVKKYRATVPMGHRLEALEGDALVFINAMMSSTTTLIEKELNREV